MVTSLRNPRGALYHVTGVVNMVLVEYPRRKLVMSIRAPFDRFCEDWRAWVDGAKIQVAFPYLNADQREFLMTGMTPDEWDRLFAPVKTKEDA